MTALRYFKAALLKRLPAGYLFGSWLKWSHCGAQCRPETCCCCSNTQRALSVMKPVIRAIGPAVSRVKLFSHTGPGINLTD